MLETDNITDAYEITRGALPDARIFITAFCDPVNNALDAECHGQCDAEQHYIAGRMLLAS